VVDAVGHRVDEVLAEHARAGTVVLDEVVAGLFVGFVVAVQRRPLVEVVVADVLVDRPDVVNGDVQVGIHAGLCDGFVENFVHPVGGIGSFGDLSVGDIVVEPLVGHDHVGDAVEVGVGGRVVGVELRQPLGELLNARVGVAVFVEDVVALDLEAEVVDAVGDRVHEIVAPVARVSAVVLDEVVAGLFARLVIAVQLLPGVEVVGADVGVDADDVVGRKLAGGSRAGCVDGFDDNGVHHRGGFSTAFNIDAGDAPGKSRIGIDCIDELIQTGAGRVRRGG